YRKSRRTQMAALATGGGMMPHSLYPIRYNGPMSSRVPQLLSNVFSSSATEVDPQALVRDFVPGPARQELVPPKRRTMIWDLHQSMHCSIIGTCLSTAELRRLLIKLNVADIENADDHESHMLGVMLAGRPDAGAKVLQKALDRRHEA